MTKLTADEARNTVRRITGIADSLEILANAVRQGGNTSAARAIEVTAFSLFEQTVKLGDHLGIEVESGMLKSLRDLAMDDRDRARGALLKAA